MRRATPGGSCQDCPEVQDVLDRANPDLSGAQLFDLANDIGEQHDLAATHAGKVKELTADWLRWSKEMATPLWGPGAGPGRGRSGQGAER